MRKSLSLVIVPTVIISGLAFGIHHSKVVKAKDVAQVSNSKSAILTASETEEKKITPDFNYFEKDDGVLLSYKVKGVKNKIGYLDTPIIAENEANLQWLIWQKQETESELKSLLLMYHREKSLALKVK